LKAFGEEEGEKKKKKKKKKAFNHVLNLKGVKREEKRN